MSTGNSIATRKKRQISAAALGVFLCASTLATRAADLGSADSLSAAPPLYGFFREPPARAPVPAQPITVAQSTPGFGAPVATPPSDLLTRLHHAFGTDPGRDVLVRNTDALLRANVRLTSGEEWHGFVYADMGAVDSALRWQGLAGVHAGHGVDLLGGWRHVTYHFAPGKGFDSLEFDGPYLGAALAW